MEARSRFRNIDNGALFLDDSKLQVNYQDGLLIFKDYVRTTRWRSVNFHFHVPSEHRVNGVRYDAEMHMVFKGETFPEENAVVGLFFQACDHAAPDKFIESLHLEELYHPRSEKNGLRVSLTDLYGRLSSYETYKYSGSLTTPQPDYTENVNWFIFANPVKISTCQLTKLKQIWRYKSYPQCVLGNARYLQKVGSRVVHQIKHTFEGELR